MNEKKVLQEKTFKEEHLDIGRRTFYTLRQNPSLQADANSKLLSLLVSHLHSRGLLDSADIDNMLLELTS